MSWSAGRQTSRKEDAAYCLMGLFDVNMPMLYGEGDRAFLRLQEEIIKTSDDMSIFAWVSEKATFSAYRGLLAQSPSDFAQCSDIHWARGTSNEPYQITNKGVHISLPFVARESASQELVALLRGVRKKPNIKLGIFLQKVGEEQYARIETNQLAMDLGSANSPTPCFVRQNIFMETASHSRAAGISLRTDSTILELLDVQPSRNWNGDTKFFAFDAPIALRTPPLAVFALRSTNTGGSGIKISVDAGKQWGAVLQVEKGWSTAPALTQFTHKIHCRKPRQPVIEVVTERGVFEGESQIVLSVVALSDDEDDDPAFKHRKLQKSFTDGMMPIRGERKLFYLD
ncbi:hypothetical protein IFR05_001091 [Cadophora sp. M221]|nr:hypothetical protein IFR05_001091 [Cadophora sp. M221]